jgi:tRNA 2-thiouridine synthesizing protein E
VPVELLAGVAFDDEGHLLDAEVWTREIACALAASRGVELGPLHWWLIDFVREHHRGYGMPPLMRVAIAAMRQQAGVEDASSRMLYRLFPDGPIREACRYGGLPRPESCI